MMKWFVSGKKGPFKITLTDNRISHIKSLYEDIERKMNTGEDLTLEEEIRYNNLGLLINKFEHERSIKEKAITIYLKDKLFHAYCHVVFYTSLLNFIADILDFPCRRCLSQGKEYRNTFKSFDVYTANIEKGYRGSFVVELSTSEVEKTFERDSILQFNGSSVCDWGSEIVMQIAVQYYVQYIGRQIIDRKRFILEVDEYLNTLDATIINWLIGPH